MNEKKGKNFAEPAKKLEGYVKVFVKIRKPCKFKVPVTGKIEMFEPGNKMIRLDDGSIKKMDVACDFRDLHMKENDLTTEVTYELQRFDKVVASTKDAAAEAMGNMSAGTQGLPGAEIEQAKVDAAAEIEQARVDAAAEIEQARVDAAAEIEQAKVDAAVTHAEEISDSEKDSQGGE